MRWPAAAPPQCRPRAVRRGRNETALRVRQCEGNVVMRDDRGQPREQRDVPAAAAVLPKPLLSFIDPPAA